MSEIVHQELIGRFAEIIESKNKCNEGIKGKLIDETKNMLVFETPKGNKKIMKNTIKLKIDGYIVDGSLLCKRPEDRIKIKVQKK